MDRLGFFYCNVNFGFIYYYLKNTMIIQFDFKSKLLNYYRKFTLAETIRI